MTEVCCACSSSISLTSGTGSTLNSICKSGHTVVARGGRSTLF